ncbi:MAG: YvcK family protein [Desulfobulbaceae bacterium]|uniref:YvcK family protein n=1 Tax=Candidatus Desulfobia pelagia TaxID=2841692 RepID=A0A8J6TCX9_9BACT|nr:YvcK family protein [Candidatus Desulfobia pelagia]
MQGDPVASCLKQLALTKIEPFDLIPRRDLVEKLIELVLMGPPEGPAHITVALEELASTICGSDTSGVKVVVFGGGSGLSNVIGGDSRNPGWSSDPFQGLKEVFPQITSIVCVTDDGGSTGELIKDLPLIALGDLRHVLLSSLQKRQLKKSYGLDSEGCRRTAKILHSLFNYRFEYKPASQAALLDKANVTLTDLPVKMAEGLQELISSLFSEKRLLPLLERPHCLGNLLLVAAIYRQAQEGSEPSSEDIIKGLTWLTTLISARSGSVLPCTTTPAHLKMLYSNGVVVSGESKSGKSHRRCPVDRVVVEFVEEPHVPDGVLQAVEEADIIVFAPGSLYTSIIPILQVPGIAAKIRANAGALKILVANLWAQQGETDISREDPGRRFYVSELISAYHRNIPGGVQGLFEQVLLLGLQDIPGSILQSYAVEDKVPIYLDRGNVWREGFAPIEARIFSDTALKDRKVQHDPASLAGAVKTIWAVRNHIPREVKSSLAPARHTIHAIRESHHTPHQRRQILAEELGRMNLDTDLHSRILEVCWNHWDIQYEHFRFAKGIEIIQRDAWKRSREWDNVFSYYDPSDCLIKIREDIVLDQKKFELSFLVGLGQSLLGNYAVKKEMLPVMRDSIQLGRIFQITLEPESSRTCFFSSSELEEFMGFVRMNKDPENQCVYTRLISGKDGFTPPGMMMGLVYAWYLDSRFSSHVEYKMAISQVPVSDLVMEQSKILHRRNDTVRFFREVVFGHTY